MVVAAALAGAWCVAALFLLARAGLDLRAGRAAVFSARDNASPAGVLAGRPLADLDRASRRLARARDGIEHPVLAPVRVLPVLGRQLRVLSVLAGAGVVAADAGSVALDGARQAFERRSGAASENAAVARRLADLATDLDGRLGRLRLGSGRGLLGPVASARRDFAKSVATLRDGLQRGAAGGRAVGALLEGPSRYLVLAGNNSEMRAGSGMFLSAGELETGGDAIRLEDMQSVTEIPVPAGSVSLEGDLRDRGGWLEPNEEWRNLMLSPRFDVQAPLAAQMWVAAGRRPVDGVIALDPFALKGLLAATGPVDVAGREIGPENVLDELLHDQYLRYSREETGERRDDLGELARATFSALDSGRWSVADLAEGMLPVVEGRHVLLWSARVEEQQEWKAAGVDGSLRSDSLLPAVLSRGGGKMDHFLHVSAELAVAHTGRDSELTLTMQLHNATPPGEPFYVSGPTPGSGVGEGVYLGIVAVSLPAAAQNGRIEGVEQLAVAGRDGPTQVVGVQLQIARDERRTVVVRFRLPGRRGSITVEPSARAPAVRWSGGGSRWSDGSPQVVTWG